MTPSYPIISIYRERGLTIFETKTSLEQITINGILNFKSNHCYYYDGEVLYGLRKLIPQIKKYRFFLNYLQKVFITHL